MAEERRSGCQELHDEASLQQRVQQLLQKQHHAGPNLSAVRRAQDASGVREFYSVGHLKELLRYEARVQLGTITHKQMCKDVHGDNCPVCTTCHFCRQKTTNKKTSCASCGSSEGNWCASCLYDRIGENIDEVLPLCAAGKWVCPVCRDICNCSSEKCLRKIKCWGVTGILIHEAKKMGYRSVAAYLILTAIDKDAPSPNLQPQHLRGSCRPTVAGAPRQQHQQQGLPAQGSRAAEAAAKRQHMLRALALLGQQQAELLQCAAQECSLGQDILGGDSQRTGQRHSFAPSLQSWREQQQQQQGSSGLLSPQGVSPGQQPALEPLAGRPAGDAAAPGTARPRQQQRSSGDARTAHEAAAAEQGTCSAPDELCELLQLLDLPINPATSAAGTGHSLASRQQAGPAPGRAGSSPAGGMAAEGLSTGSAPPAAAAVGGRAFTGAAAGTPQPQQRQQQQFRPPPGLGEARQRSQQAWPANAPAAAAVTGHNPPDGLDAPGYIGGGSNSSSWMRGPSPSQQQYRYSGRSAAATLPTAPWRQGSSMTAAVPRRPRARRQPHPAAPAGDTAAASMQAADHACAADDAIGATVGGATAAGGAAARGAGLTGGAEGNTPVAGTGPGLQPAAAPAAQAAAAQQSMLGADEDVAIIFDSDSPTAAQPADSQTAAGAAVGGAGADAAAGVGAGAEPTAKRIQLAELHAPAAAAADAAAAAAERLARVAASSACPEPLTGLQEDIEFALAQGDGLPWEDLRDRLEHILQAGFHGNTDFDRSRVMTGLSEAAVPNDAAYSQQTVEAACDRLVFLMKYVHHELFPDLVLRLSNKECFVDFGGSDPEARTALVKAAGQMLEVLQARSEPYQAVVEAWTAAGSPAPAVASTDLISQLAHAALDGMQAASEAVDELLGCMLGWMSLLHEESIRADELLQKGPLAMCPDKDSFGPLKWRPLSSYRQRDWAGMLAGQMQAEEQDLALQRKVWLETLRLSDEQLLLVLVLMLQGAARHLSRKQAVRLLTAPVITQLLDLSVPYQQRQTFVLLCITLLQQAAPDLQQHRQWQVQDVECMRQKLQQQLQAQLPGAQLVDYCADLVCQAWEGLLEPAERQQELAAVCSSVMPLLLPAAELTVSAEYQYRAPGDTHILSSLRRQSIQLGTVKVRLLAALHALQLQAGGSSWADVERSIVRPVDSLVTFFRSPRLQEHRRLVLFLAEQTVSCTPSSLSWTQPQQAGSRHQQQPGAWQPRPPGNRNSTGGGIYPAWHQQAAAGPPANQAAPAAVGARLVSAGGGAGLPQALAAPTGQPSSIPAAALLRLWLLTLLDSYSPSMFVSCVQTITKQLAVCPAAAPLMQAAGSSIWLQEPARLELLLQQDASREGSVRAGLLKAVLQALAQQQGVSKLAEVLTGVHLDLATWRQHQLDDSQRRLADVLLWERDVVPSLLVLSGLVLKHPQLNSKLPLAELVQLVSTCMQDGIKAVCGQPNSSSKSEHSPDSSGSSAQQRVCVQDTALVHLPRLLALLVHLAGLTGSCEGAATSMWPATAINSSSSGRSSGSQQTLQALLTASYPAAAHSELVRMVAGPLKEVFCLRDLLGTAFLYMSDSSKEQTRSLLELLAQVLSQQSGLSLVPPAAVDCCPAAAGFASPGLLHHVLNVHVHAACNAAAEQGTDRSNHIAVNALVLVRSLLAELLPSTLQGPPELQRLCSQQLLLPTLANPLLKVLTAGPGRCPRVQQQAVEVLQYLLAGPLGQQLLPPSDQAEAPSGSRPFGPGPLRNMEPLPQQQLQCVFLELLELSMLTCTVTAEAQAGDGAIAGGLTQQELQQRRQGAGNVLTRMLGCVGTLPQQAILYSEPRQLSAQHDLVASVPPTPQDACWRLLRAGLRFAGMLAKQQGVGLQAVCKLLMPQLHELISSQPIQMQPIRQEFEAARRQLPAPQQEAWRLPNHVVMPPPRPLAAAAGPQGQQPGQQQQRQGQQGVRPGRPQGHHQHHQQQQPRQQQQQHAAAGVSQPQQPQRSAASAAAAAPGAAQPAACTAAHAPAPCPAGSYMPFSQAGGMVASCAGSVGPPPAGTAAQAPQGRVDNGAAAAGQVPHAVAGAEGRPRGDGGGGDDNGNDDCGSSGEAPHDLQLSQAGGAVLRKKQRVNAPAGAASGPPQAQLQPQQGFEVQPDTASQDQEAPRKRQCVEQQGQLAMDARQQHPKQQQQQPPSPPQRSQQQDPLQHSVQQQQPQAKQQRLEQAASDRSKSSQQQQQRSKRSSSSSETKGLVLVGWLCSCERLTTGAVDVEGPAGRSLQYRMTVQRHRGGGLWELTVTGKLADRVKDFLERGLLLQQDLVAVKNVQLLDLPRNIVQQTRDSQLMVDPDAAAQKGLAPNEKGAAEWRNVLQMWQRGSAAKRQKASHSHASQQGQQQQQQRQPVQSQAGAKQLAQDEALQQRRRELQEKQQRQQQRILQQQQQQRLQPGQGAVGAAPGLKPAQQHVVQDSQATIPYPAPSSWV